MIKTRPRMTPSRINNVAMQQGGIVMFNFFAEHPLLNFYRIEYPDQYSNDIRQGVQLSESYIHKKLERKMNAGVTTPETDIFGDIWNFIKRRYRLFLHYRQIAALENTLRCSVLGPNEKKELRHYLSELRAMTPEIR